MIWGVAYYCVYIHGFTTMIANLYAFQPTDIDPAEWGVARLVSTHKCYCYGPCWFDAGYCKWSEIEKGMKRYGRAPKAIQTTKNKNNEGFRVTTYPLKHLRLAGTEGAIVLSKLRTLESLIHLSVWFIPLTLCYCLFQHVRWRSHHVARNWRLESPIDCLVFCLKACGDVLKIRKPVYVCQGPCTLQRLVPKQSAGKCWKLRFCS